jgi:RND family efflux transporter MFP subunit
MSTTIREDQQHGSKFAAIVQNVANGNSSPPPPPKRRKLRIPRWFWVGGGIAVAAVVAFMTLGTSLLSSSAPTGRVLTERARRTDMIVSIAEDGTLESSHNVDIKCEVQGGSTILWIIPDGTEVHKGEELVRLDSAGIQEKIDLQRIAYEKAKAIKIEAEKNFESAKIAVQEYIEGMFVQNLQTLQVAATVAKENLESARNSLQFTNRMHRKGYVTTLQRDAQAFAVQRAQLDLDVADKAIEVLEKFTKPKTVVGLESVRDAAEAKMASEESAFKLEEDRLKRLEVELEKCVIKAPADGMVVYANQSEGRRNSDTAGIEEGALVRERQTLIQLPDLNHMQVKCTVHESKVDSLQRGLRARIKVQDREFQGIVTSVANQPEPSQWFSGNVKEYACRVAIESDPAGLRPGLTAAVEILVANLPNVLSVPVQSVVEKKGQYFCWVSGSSGIEKREVQLGMSNNTRIEIKQGLSDGEQVLLNPRLSIAEAREDDHSQDEVNVKDRFGGDKPAQLPPVGPDRSEAGGKAKGKRGPRPGQGGPGGAASGAGGTSAPGGETPAAGSYRGSGGGGAGASS